MPTPSLSSPSFPPLTAWRATVRSSSTFKSFRLSTPRTPPRHPRHPRHLRPPGPLRPPRRTPSYPASLSTLESTPILSAATCPARHASPYCPCLLPPPLPCLGRTDRPCIGRRCVSRSRLFSNLHYPNSPQHPNHFKYRLFSNPSNLHYPNSPQHPNHFNYRRLRKPRCSSSPHHRSRPRHSRATAHPN